MTQHPLASTVNAWYLDNARDLPWRQEGFGAWGILVSEFMLQQTPVSRVIPRLERWLERWPAPADLAAVPPGEAVREWANLGYPRRALWLHRAAEQIVEIHGGAVPSDISSLLALTGVGDYTARAVSVFAWGRRHPVVDTNTRRVIARAVHGQAEPAPPRAQSDIADMAALLPDDDAEARVFNAAAMELGAMICTSRAPRCDECPLKQSCAWVRAGKPEYTGRRKPVQKRYEGSDRHVRGIIMAELRAADVPVSDSELAGLWADVEQRDRALKGLLSDGLAIAAGEGYLLP